MTVYGVDSGRRVLVAAWPAVVGWHAAVVAELGVAGEESAARVCHVLGDLSTALWGVYARPPNAAADERERGLWEDERAALDQVVAAVRRPHLPTEAGLLVVPYNRVLEPAHRLGRQLHNAGDAGLTEAVAVEVATEVDAVRRAELGDLSGRAVQAVAVDRLDASPVQVAAADDLLRQDPFGTSLMRTPVDAAAGCVAVAHWLAAAAEVAARAADTRVEAVFVEADDVQAVPVEVPALVVRRVLTDGVAPRQVVRELLAAAVAVQEGRIGDVNTVATRVVEALHADLDRSTEQVRQRVAAALSARLTPLDPGRPARDLLEQVRAGIEACAVVFVEHAADAGLGSDSDRVHARARTRARERFAAAVRAEAARMQGRLT